MAARAIVAGVALMLSLGGPLSATAFGSAHESAPAAGKSPTVSGPVTGVKKLMKALEAESACKEFR